MSVVDDIKTRLDIVDVVSDSVTLKKAGRTYKALCPFHTEKTPSFNVSPERQSWRCFGSCATGGDIFTFVMRRDGVEFGEALRRLADRAGVEVTQRPKEQVNREEALFRVNQEAARFYADMLRSPEGRAALKYLHDRGVDDKAIEEFQLGFSPKGRDRLRIHLSSLGADLGHATQAGLLRTIDVGDSRPAGERDVRDFFFGRLMVPIRDRRGRVAGFGGRSMDGSNPKYINTIATPIFDKQATLYGLDKATTAIREKETAVIVEGYMDVIAAHQHGYKNVVASMGTALTERQVYLVRSLTKTVILALDPDTAGQEATLRSLEASWRTLERRQLGQRTQVALRIATLPEGRDPDDLIRQSPEEWDAVTSSAIPYMDFLIPALVRRHDVSTPEGKAQAAETLVPVIVSMGNAFEQDRYFSKLADALDVSREALQASIGRLRPTHRGRPASPSRRPAEPTSVSPFATSDREPLEEYVLAVLLHWPGLKESAATHAPEEFRGTENREVFTRWLGCNTIEALQQQLDDSLLDYLSYLLEKDLTPTDQKSAGEAVEQSLARLERRYLQNQQAELLESLDLDANVPPPKDLEEPIVSVNARLKANYLIGTHLERDR